LDVAFNRLVMALVVAAGLIGSSMLGIFAEEGPQLLGLHVLAVFGFLLAAILGLWLLWGVLRSGRL
ncbi:MAG: AarF/ABC1/UbiB kinase family protein, partial [Actinomycetota bacterium]|nr:AarF/ABC1/UbiB kinase family protein [Actinomycetota bacterium]